MNDRYENQDAGMADEEFSYEGDYSGEELTLVDSLFSGVVTFLPLLSIAIQIICIVHVLKTARPIWWVFIIFFAPFIGGIIYFFAEMLPELRSRPVLRSIAKKKKASKSDIKKLEEKVDFCATVEVQSQLADAYLSRNEYSNAVAAYRECLKGVHADDEVQLYRLSEALYRNGDFAESLEILSKLNKMAYRDYQVYRDFQEARCFSGIGESEKAVQILENIVDTYAGEEARFRLGEELVKLNRKEEAKSIFEEVIKTARVYKKATAGNQKRWVRASKKALKLMN